MSKNMRKFSVKGKLSTSQKLSVISRKLRRGDISAIADKTGFDQSHVSRVLKGERNNDSIVNAAYTRVGKRATV